MESAPRMADHEASALWRLVLCQPHIDSAALAEAIEEELKSDHLDFRTRLLIQDSLSALKQAWGSIRLGNWMAALPRRDRLEQILRENLGEPGFPSLSRRIMQPTTKHAVMQFLRELGSGISNPAEIAIGGSIALILSSDLSRRTEDIDIVDEVPASIRREHELLDALASRYGLHITHFQSHYLPAGWEARLRPLGRFGAITASVVDEYDVLLSKLFGAREKDRDDLRVLAPRLAKVILTDRLQKSCAGLLGEATLRRNAGENWYIVFGEALPA